MSEEKIRLGGMALSNGVLVHGPTSWACAIRHPDGTLEVASARKRLVAARVRIPLLRGPARLVESLAVLPEVKRKLPGARLPMQDGKTFAAMFATAMTVKGVRESSRLRPAAQELVSGLLSFVPALLAIRGGEVAGYHGAEHISIGTYEHGPGATKEHERCGGHLVGPLVVTSAIGGALAARAPERVRGQARTFAQLGAVGASTEIFAWMTRHPDNALAKALSKPGHELQHRFSTAEPTEAQLEVAEAALQACLELERADDAAAA